MREDWVEIELVNACGIYDQLRKPINSKERNRRIDGKRKSELHPYYGATGQVGLIDGYLSDGEYILVGEDGAPFFDYTKSIAYLIKGKAWVNNHAHILRSYLNNKFLLYYLNQFNFQGFVSGTTRLKLTQSALKKIPIYIAPLPEQRAIVAKVEQLFSELDNGVANLKAAKDKLEIFRQAVLQKAFEGELTKEWRTKNYCDQSDFLKSLINDKNEAISKKLIKKDNYFPELTKERLIYNPPDNWLQLPWKTICRNNKYAMKRGPFGSALKKAFFVDSGYTVYEQGHAINDDPYRDRYFISEERYQDLKAFRVKPGDMIISCSGVTLGRICLLPDDCNSGIINQALLKIDLDERVILKKFFLIMFRSEAFQRKIFQKSLGTAMPNMVSMTELKELLIPVPSIEEQTQIVQEIETRLSVCDNAIANIEESLIKSEALRQSILKKAFEGKLLTNAELQACRQEPDWEPAAKLLERIKHDKKSTPRKKSTT